MKEQGFQENKFISLYNLYKLKYVLKQSSRNLLFLYTFMTSEMFSVKRAIIAQHDICVYNHWSETFFFFNVAARYRKEKPK